MTSKLLRRIHMYLALFLTPWVLMYGLSTMAMNHHESLRALYGGAPPFVVERELPYDRHFGEQDSPRQVARQILVDLVRSRPGVSGGWAMLAGLGLFGLFMWWLLPRTRRWGSLALGAGGLSFILFVINL